MARIQTKNQDACSSEKKHTHKTSEEQTEVHSGPFPRTGNMRRCSTSYIIQDPSNAVTPRHHARANQLAKIVNSGNESVDTGWTHRPSCFTAAGKVSGITASGKIHHSQPCLPAMLHWGYDGDTRLLTSHGRHGQERLQKHDHNSKNLTNTGIKLQGEYFSAVRTGTHNTAY